MKPIWIIFIAVAFLGTAFLFGGHSGKVGMLTGNVSMPASVFFTQSTSSAELRSKFDLASSTKRNLNVLIVPGHEPNFGGAEYLGIMERELNASLALDLARYLVEDGHYNVVMTRGSDGWNPEFQKYFDSQKEEINTFVQSQKTEMAQLIKEGRVTVKDDNLYHNEAPSAVAMRLYGINKWANEHKQDIIIHIHFNDNGERAWNYPGKYNGFTIYTPERQYSNSQASADIAPSIYKRLSKIFPVSNLPKEDHGVVEDQNLIAVGSNNTVDAASVLIEYGYVYESQFKDHDVRATVLKELAFQTYLGISDYFGEVPLLAGAYESTLLPYVGKSSIRKTSLPNKKVLAFQVALSDKGFYPPEYYSRNECPISGFFGECTLTALHAFQKEFGIKGETGFVGEKTSAQLRSMFEPSLMGVR